MRLTDGSRLATFALLLPLAAGAQAVLFEDTFQRSDSSQLGAQWAELSLRGDQAPRQADTAWSIRSGALTFSANGTGAYVEDFVATTQAFPVDGTRVEFELRAVTGTRQGYVGPAVLWVDEPTRKRGAYNLDGAGPGYLGLGLFYRWENQGTGGALLYAGAPSPAWQDADRKVPGVNQGRFAKHALSVKDGFVTWEADGAVLARAPLAQPLSPGAKRRLMISNRLYDAGLAQSVELRNLRITGGGGAAPPPGETFLKANAPPERADALVAQAFVGPSLVIEAASSMHDVAHDRAHWRLAIRGSGLGRFPAALSFNLAPQRGWVSTSPCVATVTRLDASLAEGQFDCVLQGFDGERDGAQVRSQGTFRAEVQP